MRKESSLLLLTLFLLYQLYQVYLEVTSGHSKVAASSAKAGIDKAAKAADKIIVLVIF